MAIVAGITALHNQMTGWRQELHAHPETAFEEEWTSNFIAAKLQEFGIEVHRGLAKTGMVGVLKAGNGTRAIGLRADMDALPIRELNDLPYKSVWDGRMHACGHDGHSTMLLGAAKYLAETRNFSGTVHFIFQPAEENEGGGRVMVEEGLFERFPTDAVFGMHNKPGIPIGQFGIRPGPMYASYDVFEITLQGFGTHAALPFAGRDPVVAAGHVITAMQTLVRSNVHPLDSAVVSITQIHGGNTWNVIPESIVLCGTARFFKDQVQDRVEEALHTLVRNTAAAHGVDAQIRYERRYPPTVNHEKETEFAARVAIEVVGTDRVDTNLVPAMAAEDFSFMLQKRPGAYINVGNGPFDGGSYLHNPRYNFSDAALPYGASYWVKLVETYLPA
jgi:hippurate hydrolase